MYAEAVLIEVVDIPLLAVNRPPTPNKPVLLKFPLFEILVNDPPLPDTIIPVNPDPSPVNLPVKLPYPADVDNVDIYALILSIVVVDKPPCRVVKFGPITVNVPLLTEVIPVIAAPPPAVSNPPTLKIPESEAFPIVREPMYALAVLIVSVEIPAVVKVPPSVKDPIYALDALIVEITP